MNASTIVYLILIGIAAGILSGLVGIGGGIVMVPMLVWIGFSQHQAQGTSLAVLSVPVTLLAAMNYYREGYLNWKYAMIIAVFFVVGGFLGSKLSLSIDEKMVKRIFGVILLFVAGKLILGK
jgi:hypothetical protein